MLLYDLAYLQHPTTGLSGYVIENKFIPFESIETPRVKNFRKVVFGQHEYLEPVYKFDVRIETYIHESLLLLIPYSLSSAEVQ